VVLLNGKPVPQAQITLHPQFAGPGWMPVASALGDGSFEVSTRQPGDGAPPGKYKLTITWHPKATDDDPGPNFLPARYAQVATSNLELEVGTATNDSVVLQLKN
jgi:hypothetical protein